MDELADREDPLRDRAPDGATAGEQRYRFLDRLGQAVRELTEASEVMNVVTRQLGEYLVATRCAYADVDADGDRFTIRNDWSLPGVASSAGVYALRLFGPQANRLLRQGQHLVVNDVDRELGAAGGADMFNAIGIKAIVCAALVKEGRLVAMMAVHQALPRAWTAAEIALIGEVVDRCWAHIERVRDSALLREQDRRKDQFLATLAHELRNPLAPIKYALTILRRTQDASRRAQAEDVIDRQVSQMARLIDDLLDLSRINRGLIRLQRAPQRLADLIQEAVEVARPMIDEMNHTLEVQAPSPDVVVDADATRLVQVIGNLLANAAKYTPQGGRIRVLALADAGSATITVSDNGMGVPPEQQARLFQPFSQLEHTLGHSRGGLGIGLSLARTLVELHGGSVALHSDGLDCGSTFTVTLPRIAAARSPEVAQPQPAAARPGGQPLRILVVEDNEDGRETLVELLQQLGHTVAAAEDGGAALAVATQFKPELVLLDLGLPVLDGIEVCRRMRADEGLKRAHIVALTGWGSDSDRARTKEAGFDLHLTKPPEPGALLHLIAAATPDILSLRMSAGARAG